MTATTPAAVFADSADSDYLVLSRGQWDAGKSPEEIQQAIDAFYAWHDQLVAKGRMKSGQRLARDARLVTRGGVVDGPFTEAKEIVGGYWFFVARSLDEACALAAQNPCLACGLQYEVRPVEPERASAWVDANETPGMLRIRRDDLTGPEIHALLEEHLRHMHAVSPPESVHALDLDKLRRPEITFWTAWAGGSLAGCGALKQIDAAHGEIKSMRTAQAHRGTGAGRAMLAHIVAEAARRGYTRLSLETGSQDAFIPARALYASAGFAECGPFEGYQEDPHSVFMTRTL